MHHGSAEILHANCYERGEALHAGISGEDLAIMLADGTITTTPIGQALIQLHGREGICPVLFGSPGVFLIGATTLEFLGLAADPVNKQLIPAVIQGRPF